MTEGEKMVWAAVFARHFMDEYDSIGKYGERYVRSVPISIEWAWSAVDEMQKARTEVALGWGENHEVLAMLDEILKK